MGSPSSVKVSSQSSIASLMFFECLLIGATPRITARQCRDLCVVVIVIGLDGHAIDVDFTHTRSRNRNVVEVCHMREVYINKAVASNFTWWADSAS